MARVISERADAIEALTEVFRKYGIEGASLSRIRAETGLGRSSLYHFFPGGKEEMAKAVLEAIDAWFAHEIFAPLMTAAKPQKALKTMFSGISSYFDSGRNICLMGSLALSEDGTPFADALTSFFRHWIKALQQMLELSGVKRMDAIALAEDTVAGIQGAITLARALRDPALFSRRMQRLQDQIATALAAGR